MGKGKERGKGEPVPVTRGRTYSMLTRVVGNSISSGKRKLHENETAAPFHQSRRTLRTTRGEMTPWQGRLEAHGRAPPRGTATERGCRGLLGSRAEGFVAAFVLCTCTRYRHETHSRHA